MKIYLYEVRVYLCDKEGFDDGEVVVSRVVAPDMPLEDAIKYMYVWALNEWPELNVDRTIQHIEKLYMLGCI